MAASPVPPDDAGRARRRRARRIARWIVRSAFLAASVAALWPVPGGRPWSAFVPAASPFVATASVLATRAFHALAWPGLAVALIALARPRIFCRWACPAGLCADGASRLGRIAGRGPARLISIGPWIAALTLGGALLGYPLLLFLDPLAMFAGLFRLGASGPGADPWYAALGIPAVLLLSVLAPNAWCGRVCPLGAFQDALTFARRTARAVLRRRVVDAIPPRSDPRPARRTVLAVALGAVWGVAARRVRASAPRPLRPPGALPEPEFVGTCLRCGNCARACPTRIIGADRGGHGIASLLTPILAFREGYCREDCTRCMEACPSGALARLAREDKHRMRIGLPRVDMDLCLLGEDRECSACRRTCPYDAIRYVFSEAEYTLTPVVDPERCTGCGACEWACPTAPRKAIVVVPADAGGR